MKKRQLIKTTVDILMALNLILLMTYELIGQAFHEIAGCFMFILFIAHLALNRRWLSAIFKGRYTALRIFQTLLVLIIFACMIGSMVSGIVLSQSVFRSLHLSGVWAGKVHMLCAYWGFMLMSVHIGLHFNIIAKSVNKRFARFDTAAITIERSIAILIIVYGIAAFIRCDMPMYLTLKYHFAVFDYNKPLLWFIIDYAAVMGLFIFIGHCIGFVFRRSGQKKHK